MSKLKPKSHLKLILLAALALVVLITILLSLLPRVAQSPVQCPITFNANITREEMDACKAIHCDYGPNAKPTRELLDYCQSIENKQ